MPDTTIAAIDRTVHEPVRLGFLLALSAGEASFTELRASLGCSDGNLSVHARKLEEQGYVECKKGYAGRIPRTVFRLTEQGRQALSEYAGVMWRLLANGGWV